tara:strand:- start:385 stop:4227 length:3843 start_codon:yes stop_codon:yes gene_type:complete
MTFPCSNELLKLDTIAIADTGSSVHSSGSLRGASNIQEISTTEHNTTDASGNHIQVTKLFDLNVILTNKHGDNLNAVNIQRVRHSEGKPFTLISVTQIMNLGYKLSGDKTNGIILTKGKNTIHFDIPIHTKEGTLWCVNMKRLDGNEIMRESSFLNTPFHTPLSHEKAHAMFGHMGMRAAKKICDYLGYKLKDKKMQYPCESCAIGKIRQKNILQGNRPRPQQKQQTKLPKTEPKNIGDKWYMDGMSIRKPIGWTGMFPTNNNFFGLIEHKTGFGISGWYGSKIGFIEEFAREVNKYKKLNHSFKVIRGDGAGENVRFLNMLNGPKWKMGITAECTPRFTPQQNRIENPFYVVSMRARALLAAANIPDKDKQKVFPFAVSFAWETRGCEVIDINGKSAMRCEHLTGQRPKWLKFAQTFGVAGTFKSCGEHPAKYAERGTTGMFIGYRKDRPGDSMIMVDPKNNYHAFYTRDVTWLKRNYFQPGPEKKNGRVLNIIGVDWPDEHDEPESETQNHFFQSNNDDDPDDDPDDNEQGSDNPDNNEQGSDNPDDSEQGSEYAHHTGNSNENLAPPDQDQESNQPTTVSPVVSQEQDPVETQASSADASDAQDDPDDQDDQNNQEQTTPAIGRRSGRTRHPRKLYSPVKPGGGSLVNADLVEAQDELLAAVHKDGELSLLNSGTIIECPMFNYEEQLLNNIDPEGQYEHIEQALGYKTPEGEYMLVAAVMKCRGTDEYTLAGATGTNYGNTAELNVMNYKQAMATVHHEEWEKAVKVEHEKMVKYNVFSAVKPEDVPGNVKLMDFAWAMKKKANGSHRARLALRGFKQIEGQHYLGDDKSAPVINMTSIKLALALVVMGDWATKIVDVQGAFLHGYFQRRKERLFASVPQGFENYYPPNSILEVLKSTYGTIQGALQWWRECCKAMYYLGWRRHAVDPCLFIKYTKEGKLMMFLLWVDDCFITGPEKNVNEEAEAFGRLFTITDETPDNVLHEYVGCKIDRTKEYIKLTQPVKIDRFRDEFGYDGGGNKKPNTPAKPGSVLAIEAKDGEPATAEEHARYRSVAGITNHMAQWTRIDVQNAQREVCQFLDKPTKECLEYQDRLTNFLVATENRGHTIMPDHAGEWDGTRNYLFKVRGESDSEYAKDPSRRSVNAGCTYLNGALIRMFSKMMPVVALSTTEAELYAAVLTAMDMMFIYHSMISMGLTVELPMKLHCDNMGAVGYANNWSCGGRIKHVDIKMNYLRELKENGYLHVVHKKNEGGNIIPDVGTKNLPIGEYWKITNTFMS